MSLAEPRACRQGATGPYPAGCHPPFPRPPSPRAPQRPPTESPAAVESTPLGSPSPCRHVPSVPARVLCSQGLVWLDRATPVTREDLHVTVCACLSRTPVCQPPGRRAAGGTQARRGPVPGTVLCAATSGGWPCRVRIHSTQTKRKMAFRNVLGADAGLSAVACVNIMEVEDVGLDHSEI